MTTMLAHVAEWGRRYPGEAVSFFTRAALSAERGNATLTVMLPPRLTYVGHRFLSGRPVAPPSISFDGAGRRCLAWTIAGSPGASAAFELEVVTRTSAPPEEEIARQTERRAARTPKKDELCVSVATLATATSQQAEAAAVLVLAKADYLQYVPAIYAEEDDLFGRLLMLFEGFWQPLEQQITELPAYFDPRTAPAAWLPWLGAWAGLYLEDPWAEQVQRTLAGEAVRLHRQRGTAHALVEVLALISTTGTTPEIQTVAENAFNVRTGADDSADLRNIILSLTPAHTKYTPA